MNSMAEFNQLPFFITDVEESEAKEVKKYFKVNTSGYVRVGPKGYFLTKEYKKQAVHIYDMPLRPDDVFVSGYPRSGCTWMRELVWMVANDFDYAKSSAIPLFQRSVTLDISLLVDMKNRFSENISKEDTENVLEQVAHPGYERLAVAPSPRTVLTHLPLSLLPPRLLESCKMVYMARDPRDVVVSMYHINRLLQFFTFNSDFKTFWNLFRNDRIYCTPYFELVKEAWSARHNPNMLFIFYEDMARDLPSTIRRVSRFLNKPCSEEQVTRLVEHLNIENFRKNKSVNGDSLKDVGLMCDGEQPFIRKGKCGGWRDYFTEEMEQQAHDWILENLRDTDLRFPSMAPDYQL